MDLKAEENEIERSLWIAPEWISVKHHFVKDFLYCILHKYEKLSR